MMAARRAGHAYGRRRHRGATLALLAVTALACGVADESKLPPDVQDPATLKTPSGAVARYRGAMSHLGGTLDVLIASTAVLTDELAALPTPHGVGGPATAVDSRTDLSALAEPIGKRLYRLRAQAREARGFLAAYAPDSSPALQGHLFAVEAYAEVWLAEVFCSGIPLSTVDFDGTYTTTPGFTTNQVYQHAIALFDSAIALAGDSVSFQRLAAVGKARALTALGQYAGAVAAVSAVPDDYTYQVPFNHPDFDFSWSTAPDSALMWYYQWSFYTKPGTPAMADREGQNGLDYRSSGDPRTPFILLGNDSLGYPMYFSTKYPASGQAMFVLASGLEARLIEAEAALQANPDDGQWLAKLNALRQTVGLADTTDPGTATARVDLLFRERAFWLYLTAHRQGDLRHLVRDYPGYAPNEVYPTGMYPGGTGAYGTEVVVPIPDSERDLNPKYTGCFHRNA